MTIQPNAFCTLEQIDDAFFDRLQCYFDPTSPNQAYIRTPLATVSNRAGANKDVRVFIGDNPMHGYVDDAVYPCIIVELKALPRPDRRRQFGGIHQRLLSEDLVGVNPNRVVDAGPEPYTVLYSIHTLSRKLKHDRLLVDFFQNNFCSNDTLTINSNSWWMFLVDSVSLDSNYRDQRIYHKVWDYSIEVDMLRKSTETTTPVATDLNVNSNFK